MGRTIFADERITEQVEGFYKIDHSFVGLIVGNLSSQKSYAVHLARTPSAGQNQTDVVSAESDSDKTSTRRSKVSQSIENIDEHWVSNHAKQVLRMLPGGLDVIGLFAVSPPDGMKVAQPKLRQLLFSVHKSLSKITSAEPSNDKISDRFLLQICPVTRKLLCRTFDVSDHRSVASPADWKVQKVLDRWVRLSSAYVLDHSIVVSEQGLSLTLHKQILSNLNNIITNISSAKATVDGRLMNNSDAICGEEKPASSKKKSNKSDMGNVVGKCKDYRVNLLVQNFDKDAIPEPSVLKCGARMLIRGTVNSLAFVPNKSSVSEAVDAVKTDIIRSLVSRCILLCEDVETTEEDQDPKILYETPRRITATLPNTGVMLCDYMFPEETLADAEERFTELLDVCVSEDGIDLDFECLPDEDDLSKPNEVCLSDDKPVSVSQKSASNSAIGPQNVAMAIGGAVAGLSALLAYVFLGQD